MARGDFTRAVPDVVFYPDPADPAFERAVVFEPGYNDPGPRGPNWCGKHGMGVRFLLRGPKGVTQFVFNAGWVPGEKGVGPRVADMYPMGWDVGYHAHVPQYEGQEPMGDCDYLGKPCYYDGSGLWADEVVPLFVAEGDRVIWSLLRERHDELEAGA